MSEAVGVDGCRGGWIAVRLSPDGSPAVAVWPRLAHLLDALPPDAAVAVDMPIGLPERVGRGGRVAECAVRPMLGPRQSSVFSVPSRAAVMETDHARAGAAALATSDPPRKVSIQCFHLFPKIREVDALLQRRPHWRDRLVETHPEVAFTVLNGGRPMALPKKVKGAVNPAGMTERRALLAALGLDPALLAGPPPRGAAADDFLDACVCALVARRIRDGLARPHPEEDVRDPTGLRIAIWA